MTLASIIQLKGLYYTTIRVVEDPYILKSTSRDYSLTDGAGHTGPMMFKEEES